MENSHLVTLIRNFLTWDLTQEEQETQFPSGPERTDCWQGKMLCFPPAGCEHPRVLLRWTLQCSVRVPGTLSGSRENVTQPRSPRAVSHRGCSSQFLHLLYSQHRVCLEWKDPEQVLSAAQMISPRKPLEEQQHQTALSRRLCLLLRFSIT